MAAETIINDSEQWRTVDGFNNYEVSNFGRVRRSSGYNVRIAELQALKPWVCSATGYSKVCLRRDGKTFRRRVHTIVAETFIGPRPTPNHQVAHGDGVRTNNRVDNLRWATAVENSADTDRHGTRVVGELHHNTKLSSNDIAAIRSRPNTGWGFYSALGREFRISAGHAWSIVHGTKRKRLISGATKS